MNTYALPALKEKRAMIAGRVISLKKQIKKHHAELASLDATISTKTGTAVAGGVGGDSMVQGIMLSYCAKHGAPLR